jgi:flagellar hook assembly protein FlgD
VAVAAEVAAGPAPLIERRTVADTRPAGIRLRIPAGAARFTLDIWDRFGRHVGTVADETRPAPGERTFAWDGRDAAGQAVPDGAYILRLTADDEAGSGILILRSDGA